MSRTPKTFPLLLAMLAATAAAGTRSSAARAEFKRLNACPSTGLARGSCPGYVIDHVQPLCAGGPDSPANMQWQTTDEAKAKDRAEMKQCRANRSR